MNKDEVRAMNAQMIITAQTAFKQRKVNKWRRIKNKVFWFWIGKKDKWEYRYNRWKLRDRRKKSFWSRIVYAINRDGDYYLVECPSCHKQQHLWKNKWNPETEKSDPCYWGIEEIHFHCDRCSICFRVYTEDGVLELKDHRDGNSPLPARFVFDDNHIAHMGITENAPWWWYRREVCRDLQENGKDSHGHYKYEIIQKYPRETQCGGSVQKEAKV